MPGDKDVIPLSRFAAILARPRGARRVEAILADRNAAALVAELPVQDLYYLVKEVGLADARELVELATPEQVQGFLDLDAWVGDKLDPAETTPWLAALVDAGPEKLTETWRGLDPELPALLLASWTRIYDLSEDQVPEWETPPFYATPDTFFLVKITAEDPETIRVVERTLDWLYRVDAELARHSLRAAASETIAYLEETAFRFRSARMEELGFPGLDEALEVYRPIAVETVRVGEASADPVGPPTVLPPVLADPTLGAGFLGQVLARVVDVAESRRLEAALVALLNRVLAADRVDPGDPARAAEGAARGAATLAIGLETVAHGDADAGLRALGDVALVRLHRVGHSVLLKLVGALDALGPLAARADEPIASLVASLRRPRPVFPRILDAPPAAGDRPFASLADVRAATGLLAQLGEQLRLVRGVLGVEPAGLDEDVTLGDVGRTAVVLAALGRLGPFGDRGGFRRLAVTEVAAFLGSALEGGRFGARAAAAVEASFPREFAPAIRGWMGDLERDLGRVAPGTSLDPRFLGGLLLE